VNFRVRPVRAGDGPVLAALHAQSWRSAYRDILADEFLARDVEADRRAVWNERMTAWDPARAFGEIAEIGDVPVGFACTFRDMEPEHGALLDNLHVLPDRRGGGIGRRLLAGAAGWVAASFPGTPMHLTVFAANANACAFYRRLGGIASEPFEGPEPDGRLHRLLRFVWPDPALVR
jgi:GNAT superfamily N-acetyltransferase